MQHAELQLLPTARRPSHSPTIMTFATVTRRSDGEHAPPWAWPTLTAQRTHTTAPIGHRARHPRPQFSTTRTRTWCDSLYFAHRRPRFWSYHLFCAVISISKASGEKLGLSLAVHHLQTSDGVVVSAVSRTSPLAPHIRAGDRILSCNGLSMSAGQLSKAATDLADLTLVVAPPLAVRAKASPGPMSMLDEAKSITRREALAALNR